MGAFTLSSPPAGNVSVHLSSGPGLWAGQLLRLAERIEMKRKLYHGSQERAEENETQLGKGPWQFDSELGNARETLMQVARGMC